MAKGNPRGGRQKYSYQADSPFFTFPGILPEMERWGANSEYSVA